ncbi:MAG TPA: VWA domain-containing protein [Bryobacteraceae bacterium]|nr:VWA domain-containing protein [Bryobacteraceae bacterium]
MWKFAWLVALPLVCLVWAQEAPQFRTEVNLVSVTCSVRSTDGHLVHDLTREDFEVFEDGVEQKVQFFARESELPLRVGLIVDGSSSQGKFVKRHQHDLDVFLESVLRPNDEALALGFGNHLRLLSDFSSSPDTIAQALQRYQKGSYDFPELGPKEDRDLGTALYDALVFTIQEKFSPPGRKRKALLVFSDGEENSSEHDLLDAIETAQRTDTLIFGLRYTQMERGRLNARNKYGIRVMDHLADQTGGAAFDLLRVDPKDAFEQISEQLRSMYEIAYASSNIQDGSYHKITIRVKRDGMMVRAKTGYYAK